MRQKELMWFGIWLMFMGRENKLLYWKSNWYQASMFFFFFSRLLIGLSTYSFGRISCLLLFFSPFSLSFWFLINQCQLMKLMRKIHVWIATIISIGGIIFRIPTIFRIPRAIIGGWFIWLLLISLESAYTTEFKIIILMV